MSPRTVHRIACALVIADDQVAMVRQTVNGTTFWSLPGGGCEGNEDFAAAARRELGEETGLMAASEAQLVCTCSYTNDTDHSECKVETYLFTAVSGDLLPQDPDASIEDVVWMPLAEAMRQLRALPWPMMGVPAASWVEGTDKHLRHWTYRIDADGKSHHMATEGFTPRKQKDGTIHFP